MIPPFRVDFADDEIRRILDAAEQVLRSGRLILGPHTRRLEALMASMTARRHGVAVNSGTSALEIIFRCLGVTGRTVLVQTNTNFATAAAAVYAGAHVELYDSGLYPSVPDLHRRLHPDVAAVVVMHVGGYVTSELAAIAGMCEQVGAALVEDAAHAHGASLDQRPAGSFGRASAFSFFPTKVVTTGEGGALVTDDDALAALGMRYRDQGKSDDGRLHELWGSSWRMTEVAAAIGVVQLERGAARCPGPARR